MTTAAMHTCSKCGETKPTDDFRPVRMTGKMYSRRNNGAVLLGASAQCRQCESEIRKDYYNSSGAKELREKKLEDKAIKTLFTFDLRDVMHEYEEPFDRSVIAYLRRVLSDAKKAARIMYSDEPSRRCGIDTRKFSARILRNRPRFKSEHDGPDPLWENVVRGLEDCNS